MKMFSLVEVGDGDDGAAVPSTSQQDEIEVGDGGDGAAVPSTSQEDGDDGEDIVCQPRKKKRKKNLTRMLMICNSSMQL